MNTLSFDFEEADGIRSIHETKNADGKAYDLLDVKAQDSSTGIIINEEINQEEEFRMKQQISC